MKNRLTWYHDNGNFGVEGVTLDKLSPELYACIYKLKRYEDTGLSPEEIENMSYQMEDLKIR